MAVGTVTRVSADGTRVERVVRTGRPNGLARDHAGRVWLAESLEPRVMTVALDGSTDTVFDRCAGRELLWPNDLCFGPDGALYLTDSGVAVSELLTAGGINPAFRTLSYRGGVYRWDLGSGNGRVIDVDLRFANGIAFGPDGMLYVSESVGGNIYRYRVSSEHPERELFANVIDPADPVETWHGPDGMAFSTDGRLWVTVFGQGQVAVVEPSGEIGDRLRLAGRMPTNCAFGPPGSGTLYVVENEHGTIEAHRVDADGLALRG
jgi:gluconolactonase